MLIKIGKLTKIQANCKWENEYLAAVQRIYTNSVTTSKFSTIETRAHYRQDFPNYLYKYTKVLSIGTSKPVQRRVIFE